MRHDRLSLFKDARSTQRIGTTWADTRKHHFSLGKATVTHKRAKEAEENAQKIHSFSTKTVFPIIHHIGNSFAMREVTGRIEEIFTALRYNLMGSINCIAAAAFPVQ
ncbi:MAG: hypothetical protein ABI963_08035 [Rhizomicrobium sp.]